MPDPMPKRPRRPRAWCSTVAALLLATVLGPVASAATLDIDGDGAVSAATDGQLILRHLFAIIQRWDRGFAWFARVGGLLGYNRVSGGLTGNFGPLSIPIYGGGIYLITKRAAFALYGACAASDTACLSNRDPVLFIHGYAMDNTLDPLGFALGGGAGTWGDFPQLIQAAGLVPFEFRWNSAARFQDAAADLATAIRAIRATTGRRVHLVAHSFGGLLVRTLLQRYDLSDDDADIGAMIGKVVNLGTPHAGIAYQPKW